MDNKKISFLFLGLFAILSFKLTAQTTVTEVVNGLLAPSGTAFYNDVMYVSEYNQNRISMVDLNNSSSTPQTFFDFGYDFKPEGLLLDGTTLYIGSANYNSSGIYKVDDITATTPTLTQVAAVPGSRIIQMVRHDEGQRKWLYFADHSNQNTPNVSRIDLADSNPAGTLQEVIRRVSATHVAVAIYGDMLYTTSPDGIYELDLSTWDPTADFYSMNNVKSITAQTTDARSIAFNTEGTRMLVLGATENKVYRYELGAAWDLSTATYLGNDIILGTGLSPTAIALVKNSSDSYELFVTDISGKDTSMPKRVLGYFLNSDLTLNSWNSSYSFSLDTGIAEDPFNPTSITFSGSGDKMYVAHNGTNKRIYQYQLATAWDPSSASSPSFYGLAPANNGGLTSPSSVTLSADGRTMSVADGTTSKVHQYDLATSWDITTAIYASVSHDVSAQPYEVAFNANNTQIFILGDDGKVYEYTSTVQQVASGLEFVSGMALSSNILYFSDFFTNKVYRMALWAGYTTEQIADGVSRPLGTTLYKGDLYFSERAAGSVSKFTPTVYTCPADVSVTAALGEATAAVTYDDPVLPNSGWTVTRTDGPASGEDFPVGETTVTFDVIGPGVSTTCTLTVNVYASEWEKVGDFSALSWFDGAADMDLAMDGDVPYIAYSNDASGISVAKYGNGTWSLVGTKGFSQGDHLDLEVHNGIPYIAFNDGGSNTNTRVQSFVGGTWSSVGSISVEKDYMNLEIDGSGYPYLVSIANAGVLARRFTGSSWNLVGTDGFASSGTWANWRPLGLAFHGNTPYVAFQDATASNRATVMKYNGASWAAVGGAGISNGTSTKRNLAVDGSNGDLYLAYADGSLSNRTVVKKYDSSQWSDVGDSQGISIGVAETLSIEVDGNNTPYLALSDIAMGNRATVLRFNGTEWVSVGDAFFSEPSATMSMALDSKGVPHVATFDGDHSLSGNGNNIALWAHVPTELSIADAPPVMEGEMAVFTLGLGRPINEDITVTLELLEGTATEGDYELPTDLTVIIEKGHSEKTFEVATIPDMIFEQTGETFQVQITGVTAGDKRNVAWIGSPVTGTIRDDTEPPTIIINGPNPLYLEVGQTFSLPKVEADDNLDKDLTQNIETSGSVDINTVGTYEITYTVSDQAGNETSETLTVIVWEEVNDIPPTITILAVTNPLYLEVGQIFMDPGAEADDNIDGDLTDQITVSGSVDTDTAGTYGITYTVSDQAGNTTSETLTVIVWEGGVDDIAPSITILAATNPIYLEVGRTFVAPGAEAYDNVDGDLTDQITVSGSVDTDTAGTYGITYTVSDQAGNTTSETLIVIVREDGTGPEPDCDLLGLDSDSFTVSVADETCTGRENGSITVAVDPSLQGIYLASLDNGTEQPIDGELTFDGLEPGEYRLCVRLHGSDCYQCHTATVREGASIAAGTTAKDGVLAVSMRAGTAPFSVRVNGILRATHSESEFTVAASESDQVEIASALPCEGTLSLGDGIPEKIIAYPNPVSDRLTVEGLQNGIMRFSVLTLSGNTVLSGEMEVPNRSAQLDVGMLGMGTYLVLIDQGTGPTALRFIKR